MPFPELGPTCPATGPRPAGILIIGEAPNDDDLRSQSPFSGRAGEELTKMLHESGILRSECRLIHLLPQRPRNNDLTNFFYPKKTNPPPGFIHHFGQWVHPLVIESIERIAAEIAETKPDLIITLGNAPLWALSRGECIGAAKWRGSQLELGPLRVLPTYNPALVIRQWEYRAFSVLDFKRARRWLSGEAEPRVWNFIIRPSFTRTITELDSILSLLNAGNAIPLSVDLETRAGHIACCGIAWSKTDAISIPFMCVENIDGYFSPEEEITIILKLQQIFTHPHVLIIGQNFAFDTQYIYRHWHFIPKLRFDTLIAQGLLWPGLPKALDFLSSMYCRHHLYWKEDGKLWDPTVSEEQLWSYNCVDACRTFEIYLEQQDAIHSLSLTTQHHFLLSLWMAVMKMMITGVRIDKPSRSKMAMELMTALSDRDQWFIDVLGHPLNPRSSKQMGQLIYEDLRAPVQRNRKTGSVSADDKALEKIKTRQPLLAPLIKTIQDYRSIGVFLSTFVNAALDTDDRMRCSYNIVGTETFRFNSSKNPFDSGTNLQNIPAGNEAPKPGDLAMPNIRRLFIPDSGFLIADADLDRADLQVVVWEANDALFKQMLHEGVDIHSENAKALGISRQLAKSWVHGTNYGGGPRTMAVTCGLTVHQAERMQRRWFEVHPGIKEWHDRTMLQLETTRSVTNRFGFRRFYFDRIEGLLPEALAWIPQSTVANVINTGLLRISVSLPEVQILLQVHDSLVFQIKEKDRARLLPQIRDQLLVTIPYEDPLVIPVGLKLSSKSWGECKDARWE